MCLFSSKLGTSTSAGALLAAGKQAWRAGLVWRALQPSASSRGG
jgi:hypothetical protein